MCVKLYAVCSHARLCWAAKCIEMLCSVSMSQDRHRTTCTYHSPQGSLVFYSSPAPPLLHAIRLYCFTHLMFCYMMFLFMPMQCICRWSNMWISPLISISANLHSAFWHRCCFAQSCQDRFCRIFFESCASVLVWFGIEKSHIRWVYWPNSVSRKSAFKFARVTRCEREIWLRKPWSFKRAFKSGSPCS